MQRSLQEVTFNHHLTKEAAGRVTVPLGPENGYSLVPVKDWRTEVQDAYVQYSVDPREYREAMEMAKAMHNRPTCAVGAMAGGVQPQSHDS